MESFQNLLKVLGISGKFPESLESSLNLWKLSSGKFLRIKVCLWEISVSGMQMQIKLQMQICILFILLCKFITNGCIRREHIPQLRTLHISFKCYANLRFHLFKLRATLNCISRSKFAIKTFWSSTCALCSSF